MKNVILSLLAALAALPAVCFGQDGTDIDQAIPIYFGQTINDNVDVKTRPNQVYSITLGKSQQFSVTTTANARLGIFIYDANQRTIHGAGTALKSAFWGTAETFTYQVASSGVYYLLVQAFDSSVAYKLTVASVGPIVPTAPCSVSGTASGPVSSITYSLNLIAAGLPDSTVIGGTTLCATCSLKPPAYPELVNKIEKAMGLGLNVSAGFDSNGNMCQISLVHP